MTTLADIKTALERRIGQTVDATNEVSAINIALEEIGNVTKVDETLTVVNDQTEYSLPSGVSNVVRVQIANSSSADYDYTTIFTWRETNGKLYLPDELGFDAGNKIRIYYNDTHDAVSNDADTIDDDIPIPLLIAIARYWYEVIEYQEHRNISTKDNAILDMLRTDMYTAISKYRVNRMYRDPIHGS